MPYTQSDTQSQGVYSYRTLSPITQFRGFCTYYTQSNTQSRGLHSHLTHSPAHSVRASVHTLHTVSGSCAHTLHTVQHSSLRASVHTLHTVQRTVPEPLYIPCAQFNKQSQGLCIHLSHSPAHSLRVLYTYLIHSPTHSLRASVHTLHIVHSVQHTVLEPLYTPYTPSNAQSQGLHPHLALSPSICTPYTHSNMQSWSLYS